MSHLLRLKGGQPDRKKGGENIDDVLLKLIAELVPEIAKVVAKHLRKRKKKSE